MITILFVVLKLTNVLLLNWWWVIATILLDILMKGCCGSKGFSCCGSKAKKEGKQQLAMSNEQLTINNEQKKDCLS